MPDRDLKTSNVLLTKEHLAKISDVGLACIQSGSDNTYEFAQGTFSYVAPEVILGDKCTKAVRSEKHAHLFEGLPGSPAHTSNFTGTKIWREVW